MSFSKNLGGAAAGFYGPVVKKFLEKLLYLSYNKNLVIMKLKNITLQKYILGLPRYIQLQIVYNN